MDIDYVIWFYILTCLTLNTESCQVDKYWKKFTYNGPDIFNYHILTPNTDVIRCIAVCQRLYIWTPVYHQDGDCYCLAPGIVTGTETVTTNSAIWINYQDAMGCTDKGYTVFKLDRYCLKMFSTKESWHNAYLRCQKDGGHLISIYTQQDFTNFKSVCPDYKCNTGGYRTFDGADFKWLTGGSIPESFWYKEKYEPNNASGMENCVSALKRIGEFFDWTCDTKHEYVCQILLK